MHTPQRIKPMQRLVMISVLSTLLGCAPTPRVILPSGQAASHTPLSSLLAAHPLAVGQNISALPLGHTEALSFHLIQIRDREQPHRHATHDLSVTVLRGTGRLYVAGDPHEMRAGDVAVVPRGTPHYFVNAGSEPAVAFATFAPPYDGTDQIPVQ
jgi:mannose-6-phosphate isomerase-like protein (cupin superfamily)